jgi:hypothetical protein
MINRFGSWMTVEPTVGLLMIITALVLFGSAFMKSKEAAPTFWQWLKRIIEASVGAVLFLGLLWGFRSILNSNNATFNNTHGSISDANYWSAQSIWGKPHVQWELEVHHFITKVVQEEIPREDPTLPPLYRDVTVTEEVPQNSILSFNGDVKLTLSEREKGYALYNGYLIDGRFEYSVVNDSDLATDAQFYFPLMPGQTLYENFTVAVDGNDISSQLQYSPDVVQWNARMTPHQRDDIVVTYSSRGMDYFYYQIRNQRQINDFILKVTVDRLSISLLNYPEGCLTPTRIEATADGKGSVLTWEMNHSITVAGMGVALPQPEQPGAKVMRVLTNSPYALTLMIAMLAITLLIRGQPVHFLELALLSGAYCVQFLVMASVSDYFFGFWGSMILGAALTGVLTFLLFRKHKSKLLRVLIYVLVGFFAFIYPLAGLLTDMGQRNSFDGLVQIGLIIYIFGLALLTRVEAGRSKNKA